MKLTNRKEVYGTSHSWGMKEHILPTMLCSFQGGVTEDGMLHCYINSSNGIEKTVNDDDQDNSKRPTAASGLPKQIPQFPQLHQHGQS